MLVERMRKRAADRASFIEPCLPCPADKPRPAPTGFTRSSTTASGSWPAGIPGASGSSPAAEMTGPRAFREVVCCDEGGVAAFNVLRRRRNEPEAFLYAFDLLELDGTDLRREPIEVRKAT